MPPTRHLTQTQGLALVAGAAVTWGIIPLLVRSVTASSFVIVFWRVVFAGLAVVPLLAMRSRWREFALMSWRRRGGLAVQGALLALNWVLFFTGLKLAPVAVAELLAYTGPVLVAALGPWVARERFDRRIIAPLALSLVGTAVILGPSGDGLTGTAVVGAAAAFASALTYATLVLNAKRLLPGVSTELYMTVEWVVAAAVLLPFVVTQPSPEGARAWGSLIVLGVVSTAITGFMFVSALRVVRADRAATLTYLEPASAVIFAAAFLGEPLTLAVIAGGLLIVGGGILVARLEPEETTGAGMETP
jgi:drug/metabolite transporter (DMT)-like permease